VTVETPAAIDFPITSYAELTDHADAGYVTVTAGEPNHPDFFSCPLLRYKG
jgi:hypothetical protein